MKNTKPQTAQPKSRVDQKVKKQKSGNNVNNAKNQLIDKQISNFEQHKAIKILQKEGHIQSIEQRVFLASYLRRHIQQFRELDGDPMEFLMALSLNLKYVFLPKGKVIFHENENKDDLFFILDGDVQFYSRKTEQDISTEKFWFQQVQSKSQYTNQLSNRDHHRLHKDEEVLKYYKCSDDENLFRHSKKKNMYFLDGVLLFKKTYQRNKGMSFGVDEKDNSQTAVAKTDAIVAVTSQCDYVQSYAKYKEKNSFAFDCLKKFIAPLIAQYPTRIDDKTLREIASKTTPSHFPLHQSIYDEISESTVKDLPNMNQKSRNELGLNESIYIVKQGYVEYYQNYENSEKRGIKVSQLNEGEIFGHECLFKPEQQNYTVISATPFTQILQLKKEYICENDTLHDILLVRGQQFLRKLQISQYNGKPQKQLTVSTHETFINEKGEKYLRISKQDVGMSNSQLKLQSKNDLALKAGSKQQLQNPSPQSQPNIHLKRQSQPTINQLQIRTINSQTLLLNQKQLSTLQQINKQPLSQQAISSIKEMQINPTAITNQPKIKPPSILNVPLSSRRKESIKIDQDDFEGSFDYLEEDGDNSQTTSKLEQDLEKYKQKSRTILSAVRSCTQIQQENINNLYNSPENKNSSSNNSHQQSPYLQVPTPRPSIHRKSLSTHASPFQKITLVINEENDDEQTKQNGKGLSLTLKGIKERVEEIKLSPTKLTSIEKGCEITNIKNYLKNQRNAKIPPSRQPDEFRIKNSMFDTSSQSTTANNGVESQNENDTSPVNQKLASPYLLAKDSNLYQINSNYASKNGSHSNTKMNIPQLNIQQSIYYSYEQINPSTKETNNNNQNIVTQQSSRSNEDNAKVDSNRQQAYYPTSPILDRLQKVPNKLHNKFSPVTHTPTKSFEKVNSPIKQNYLSFKEKHFSALHIQKEKGPYKLQAN